MFHPNKQKEQHISNISQKDLINYIMNLHHPKDEKQEEISEGVHYSLFDNMNKVYSYDVIDKVTGTEEDISFYSSILTCILDKFSSFNDNDKCLYINRFIWKMITDVKKRDTLKLIQTSKIQFDKKGLVNTLQYYKTSEEIIIYIAAYLRFNIFIVDMNKNSVAVYYPNVMMNPYKKSIVLGKEDNNYSIFTNDNKYYWTTTNLIQNLEKCEFQIYGQENKLEIGDDDDLKEFTDKHIDEEEQVELPALTKEIIEKMNCIDLKETLKKFKIDVNVVENGKRRAKRKSELLKDLLPMCK